MERWIAVEVPIDQIIGPTGALVLAVIVIGGLVQAFRVLWSEHMKADEDDRKQRDDALSLVHDAVEANKAHAEANRLMAQAWETRNRQDAARARRTDR